MKKALAPLILSGVLLTSCQGGDVENPTPDDVLPRPPLGAPNTAVPPIDVPTGTPSVSPAPAALLVLKPDGVSAVGETSGLDPSEMLDFGDADQQAVRSLLTNTFTGGVTSEQVQCPQGERSQVVVDGFETLFDPDGTFVGWTDLGSAERNITTANGIGLRSTIEDVERGYSGVSVDGDSFEIDNGLSGTLDNLNQVETLSGGETCAAE